MGAEKDKAIKSCIYLITNNLTEKVYVGSTCDFDKRQRTHLSALRKNIHHSRHLQASWDRYGSSHFSFSVLETVLGDQAYLIQREQYWIDEYECYQSDFGYNCSPTAGGGPKGMKWSEESKRQKSLDQTGRRLTAEWKANIAKANLGRTISQDTRRKLSLANMGKTQSPKTREKLSRLAKARVDRLGPSAAKITWDIACEIREERAAGVLISDLADKYSLSISTISRVVNFKTWLKPLESQDGG